MKYLDGTLGGAGHALKLAESLRGKLWVIGLDRDPSAIERAKSVLDGKADKVILECENYRNLDKVLDKNGVERIDAMLLDLGISSDELEASGKGFSFQRDEPLFMTMGDPNDKERHPFTAADIVNGWEEETLANIIYGYGEERFARRIARSIVAYRLKKKIETSHELGEVVKMAVPPPTRRGKIHPATRTFQALRIAVNDELGALKDGLKKGFERLAPKGRMTVISFHSIEDRIVKEFFKARHDDETGVVATKKPVTASDEEVQTNPRARSAKLRTIVRK